MWARLQNQGTPFLLVSMETILHVSQSIFGRGPIWLLTLEFGEEPPCPNCKSASAANVVPFATVDCHVLPMVSHSSVDISINEYVCDAKVRHPYDETITPKEMPWVYQKWAKAIRSGPEGQKERRSTTSPRNTPSKEHL